MLFPILLGQNFPKLSSAGSEKTKKKNDKEIIKNKTKRVMNKINNMPLIFNRRWQFPFQFKRVHENGSFTLNQHFLNYLSPSSKIAGEWRTENNF